MGAVRVSASVLGALLGLCSLDGLLFFISMMLLLNDDHVLTFILGTTVLVVYTIGFTVS